MRLTVPIENRYKALMPQNLFDFSLLTIPILILLVSLTLPPEMSLSLGSLRLSPYRICLILMIIPAITKVLSRRDNGFNIVDFMMFFHSLWAMIALTVNMGIGAGIESGGIYFVETFGAYILARAYIRSLADYQKIIALMFRIVSILLVFAIIESFSGVHFIRNAFQMIMGGAGPHYIEPRLGLTRAFTSFEHPILFGVFSASIFAGVYYVLLNETLSFKNLKKIGIVVGATFFSLSGGPYTALALQIGLIGWDKLTKGIHGRWTILASLFLSFWFLITLLSNRSPVNVFISYLTFSANSAYNRIHIWNYGSAEVGRHPLFGIGLNEWVRAPWMSSSMDNYWLLTTVRYGLPAFIAMIIAILIILKMIHPKKAPAGPIKSARKAFVVTLIGMSIAGITVHFWNALMVQFFFFLGCAMSLKSPNNSPLNTSAIRR
ncbi:hypothetical protein QGN29_02690 [Temperatibacter marinus]|uniref:Uncharacterized protein n=1 Tax=Temperatibacter marinus TaxID=1456591 RepID=A0AA52HB05_9PROT|nr:hypothetical protein [Temperatibacter marinus]WND03275.1 hypothetical protein QGN29_02690 [Temperatibacter marinus]